MNMINNTPGNMGGTGNGFFPWFFNKNEKNDESDKMSHDIYHIYVNGDYVGDRVSLTQGDGGPHAIDSYLKGRNFDDYKITYEGDRVYIEIEDENQEESIRNHLRVYTELK